MAEPGSSAYRTVSPIAPAEPGAVEALPRAASVPSVPSVVVRRGTLQGVHIPDGYLSPSTCAALYAGAAPFWWVALRRLKRTLHTRLVPRISLFAAFSFVVMMFNIPLPGGTTGHAIGVALAAIVLGPSASILAVSMALVIQAFFFGDGGITALGANCFNIAIVGSLVAFVVYRVVAGRAPIGAPRRVVAAGLAGYAAINVAALFTAVEFGIQPLLFRDASGAPLYCPYPARRRRPRHDDRAPHGRRHRRTGADRRRRRVPAADRCLAARSDGGTPGQAMADGAEPTAPRSLRPLWLTLGLLLVLTPLGLLAGGTRVGRVGGVRLRGSGGPAGDRRRRRSATPRRRRRRQDSAPGLGLDRADSGLRPAVSAQRRRSATLSRRCSAPGSWC